MADSPIVELVGVGKTFANGSVAVECVSFSVGQGEIVTLLGPSGCGKSTVLKLVAGLSDPTRGAVHRSWKSETVARDSQQPVAVVFQEPTLLPWANVWKNVYLPLRLSGVDRRNARSTVDGALQRVGLSAFKAAYPRQLSGGMKMRTALARALVTQPRLLLLDEPFAALDEINRSRLNDELLGLWRERGWSMVFVTHSVYEAVYLSHRVLVMSPRPGRIAKEIPIDLPTRQPTLRTSSAYIDLCRHTSALLERAMQATADEVSHDG